MSSAWSSHALSESRGGLYVACMLRLYHSQGMEMPVGHGCVVIHVQCTCTVREISCMCVLNFHVHVHVYV